MNGLPRGPGLAAAALLCLLAAGCAVNPATGKRQLALIGEKEEIQLGRETDRQVVAGMGLYGGEELQRYLQRLGERLAAGSERPDLPWTFRVVDDPAVNAFALPGGYVYVTRGILAHLDSEAELASVVGHEIGHVTARHGVNQMSKTRLAQLGLGLGAALGGDRAESLADLAEQGLGVLFLKFSRDDERQADDLGLRYLIAAGYDPRPMPEVFEVLRRVGEAEGGSRTPAWLSTHPAPENRKARLEQEIAERRVDLAGREVGQAAYYERIDGIVFGTDPREGYFDGNRFYHPEMQFVFSFPESWAARNSRSAVSATSPGGDAWIGITLAEQSSPESALEEFLDREGVLAGAAWPDPVPGYAAASREFAAETSGGAARGLVVFLRHGDRVLRLLGYATRDAWGAQRPAVEAALASFARLADPAALSVEPRRLKIVRAGAGETLQQLARRHEATVPVETLALINHLEPGERLRAGAPYKVVRGGRLP